MTNELNIDIQEQEEKKEYAAENFNNYTLDHYLAGLSKDELKNICRNLSIKGFSSKNKEDLIQLITTSYFSDFTILQSMLKSYDSGYKVVLDKLSEQAENYMVFHYDVPDDVFLFYAQDTELLFIPKDVKTHFLAYKKEHPEFKADIDNIHFYRSALNLYGFVSLKHLQTLKEKYYSVKPSEEEIREEIIALMPEYEPMISGSSIKHIELAPVQLNLQALTEGKTYYIPSFDEFIAYTERFYIERTQEVQALERYLADYIIEDFKDTDTSRLIVNTILFGLRANETPDQILLHIDNVEANGFMQFTTRDELIVLIREALNTTRLWTLHGFKKAETNSTAKKVKKKHVQVKRKTKKRGKNRNIAHVAKLKAQEKR
ncbi:hypothetical protein [Macrococcus equi]|uniref:hypothetical protein n=1 Tax=Macrococcus equi TaxID=3395462 RepID=UPI0039BEC1AC